MVKRTLPMGLDVYRKEKKLNSLPITIFFTASLQKIQHATKAQRQEVKKAKLFSFVPS
jgi:hypothetical protein